MGKINRVFPSVTFMFQSISFSFDPRGPCRLKQRFRRQLNWVVSLPLSKFWHNCLSSIQRPGSKWKGDGAMPGHVSPPLTQLLLRHHQGISKYLEIPVCVLPTPGTATVFTELQALPCALGVQLTPNNPTTKPSGASKPLTAVGFNLSLWRMTMSLKESSYPTPFQQTPW